MTASSTLPAWLEPHLQRAASLVNDPVPVAVPPGDTLFLGIDLGILCNNSASVAERLRLVYIRALFHTDAQTTLRDCHIVDRHIAAHDDGSGTLIYDDLSNIIRRNRELLKARHKADDIAPVVWRYRDIDPPRVGSLCYPAELGIHGLRHPGCRREIRMCQ